MVRLKKRFWQLVLAMLVGFGALAGTALPAHSATWYSNNAWCGTFFTTNCATLWTGGYPTGMVRGSGQMDLYEVVLQTKTSPTGAWSTVARTYPQTSRTIFTPAVKAGKWNTYNTCVRFVKNGPLWCRSNKGGVYLGD